MKICLLYREGVLKPGLQTYFDSSYQVDSVPLREDYLDAIIASAPDVVILDFVHDTGASDDTSLVKGIRSVSRAPIFLAVGKGVDAQYREYMFNSGVDGCVQAPFLKDELIARLNILIKKRGPLLFTGTTVKAGGVQMDLYTHEVTKGSRPLSLTKTEHSILLHLLLHKHSVVPTDDLSVYIHKHKEKDKPSLAVNVHILNIRKKLGGVSLIRTIPHYGFLVAPS